MLSALLRPLQEPEAEKLQLPNEALSPWASQTPPPNMKFLELPRDRGVQGLSSFHTGSHRIPRSCWPCWTPRLQRKCPPGWFLIPGT